ncbi:hypothetical protein B0H17DRAFT_1137478 [Mycena rosella]|uniref:Uncharacterized protein n=1 Tax=Mycena rosella TaxID=1033263 RepID=A0AAD7D9W9_MYCRO|nr:hypothetical protein B0H17DRAFT_1137478 [Mycena rosella]
MRTSIFTALLATFALAVSAADTVLTPGGHRLATNVKEVPAGGRVAHVGNDIHVIDANGTVLHIATPSVRGSPTAAAVSPEETGWVAFASWLNTGAPIGSFKASWTVPPMPASQHGQTLFLFNSIEPATGDAIMQPYGGSAAGGGQFWSVATWYLYMDQTFFTTPVQVSVGQTLDGIVELVGTSGSTFTYNSQFTNIGGTSLTIAGSEQLAWATITLEAYAVTTASDYPTGSTVFSGTNLELSSGVFPSVSWSTQSDPADGLSTTINVEGSTSATITIKY